MESNKKIGDKTLKMKKKNIKWCYSLSKIWNSETGECLGRTGISWTKIIFFYILFFTLLLLYLCFMMFILHMTLDDQEPKYKLNDSKIGSNPGLGFRPAPPSEAVLSSIIWFNESRSETIEYWVSKLNDVLEPYHDSTLETCSRNERANRSKACYFPIPSGNHSCTPKGLFGFDEGKPCVLLKLNNIFDWIPIPYLEPPSMLRNVLRFPFEQNRVYISCEGANPSDRDNIGEVEYFPHQGIPTFYYPFTNQNRYLSPFLFVQFTSITRGVLVKIECRAWAQNIAYDKDFKTGGVHFELLVD